MQPKVLIASALVGVVLMLSGSAAALFSSAQEQFVPRTEKIQSEPTTKPLGIIVDISGAVVNPGVYSLPPDSRLEQAIKMAGGVSDKADANYLAKSLNLSQKITDGMKIYIPAKNEAVPAGIASSQTPVDSLIDINSASADQLDKLPGIGPTTSANIIAKRPYLTVNDLLAKKVISKSVFTKVEKLIVAR